MAEQIDRRVRGLKITDRLVSIADPDARPIRKGKLGKPTEFGYVAQICEVTENTRRGARGFILPAGHAPGNPAENRLLPQTAAELDHAGIRPREIVVDGGFQPTPTKDAFPDLSDDQIQLSGRHEPGSAHPQTPSPLPHRHRRTHQPPQTPLRPPPLPPQRPRRNANLDRLGDPRLRPRHPRHPNPLTHSTPPDPPGTQKPDSAAPNPVRPFQSEPFIRGK